MAFRRDNKETSRFSMITISLASPEMILEKGNDKSVDIWSIGVLTFELINGRPPFTPDSNTVQKNAQQMLE